MPRSSWGHFRGLGLTSSSWPSNSSLSQTRTLCSRPKGKERFTIVQLIYIEYLIWTRQPSRYWVGEGRLDPKRRSHFCYFHYICNWWQQTSWGGLNVCYAQWVPVVEISYVFESTCINSLGLSLHKVNVRIILMLQISGLRLRKVKQPSPRHTARIWRCTYK